VDGTRNITLVQVKNRQRVADHGEVFSSEREVNGMLDMVEQETLRIEPRFLEPACGTGNFLAEIFHRKMTVVFDRYKKSQLEFERFSILADNVKECRERLLNIFEELYRKKFKERSKDACISSIGYILEKNILLGDALTFMQVDKEDAPIIFSEWSPVNGSMIKRRDYTLAHLLADQPMEGDNLFSDLGDQAFIPKCPPSTPLALKIALV
jgi:SAM-dependent methyltransferase